MSEETKSDRQPQSEDFPQPEDHRPRTPDDDDPAMAYSSIANELQVANKTIRYQQYLFIFTAIVAIDILTFPEMRTWSAPVAIASLELVGLLVLAGKQGITEAQDILDKCLAPFSKN